MGYFEMDYSGVGSVLPNLARNTGGTRGTQEYGAGITGLPHGTAVPVQSFSDMLQTAGETKEASRSDMYQQYLKQRYGNVMIQSVGIDQSSMDKIGAATSGTGNVVIAPNILEQMADDPKKASYYEAQIRHYFDSLPQCKAQLSLMGHEIHSSGIVIHPDGTVTHYVSGDLKPEVRARNEAQMKAEAEEKAKRKRMYQKRSEETAGLRRQEMELAYRKQSMLGDILI